jgi:glycosyltransferase involved in cell wall biosynthesis
MRLGFHYHIPARVENGRINTMSLQGLFIDSLAPRFKKIVLFLYAPLESEISSLDYTIQSDNVELVSLVKHYSIPMRLVLSPLVRLSVRRRMADIDMMLVRAPTPLLPLIIQDVRKKLPFAYLVVGEMSDHIDNLHQPAWRKALLKKYILWNEARQREYANEGLVFANSAVVFEKYKTLSKRVELIYTTTLKECDFFVREDTCQQKTVRVLFTGRIERGKGIIEIVEAVVKLNNAGLDCCLDIVGWSGEGDSTPETINEISKKNNIGHKIVFHGKKKVGEELFAYYRNADIFILASQVAEGFPRTIWEALANSLPVISTSVGSVPFFLKDRHDVLSIEKKSVDDIVEKVRMVVADHELRRRLIKNGIERVREVTLETQAKRMFVVLTEFYQQNRN